MDYKLNIAFDGSSTTLPQEFKKFNAFTCQDQLLGIKRKCATCCSTDINQYQKFNGLKESEPREESKEYCRYSETFTRKAAGEAAPAYVKKFKYEGPLAPFPPVGGKGLINGDTDYT